MTYTDNKDDPVNQEDQENREQMDRERQEREERDRRFRVSAADNWKVDQEDFRRLARTGEFTPEQKQE